MKRMTRIFIFLIMVIATGQERAQAVVPPSVVKEEGVIVENERYPAILESIQRHKAIIHKMKEDFAALERELEHLETEVKQMDCASQ